MGGHLGGTPPVGWLPGPVVRGFAPSPWVELGSTQGVVWCVVWCDVEWSGVVWWGGVWCAGGTVTKGQWPGVSCTWDLQARRAVCLSARCV